VPAAATTPVALALVMTCRSFVPVTLIVNVLAVEFPLPFAPTNESCATPTFAVPVSAPAAVNVTVRVVPLVVSADNEPRDTEKSASVRSLTDSLNVIVIEQVEPAASAVPHPLSEMVGRAVM
jgi:hypothetical protein